MTVLENLEREIENIREKMCEEYCRKPEEYLKAAGIEGKSIEDMSDLMTVEFCETVCDKCPLGGLV